MATMPLGTGAELSTGQRAACQYHNLLQKTTSMGSGGSRTEDRRYDAGVGRFISEDFIKGHTAVPTEQEIRQMREEIEEAKKEKSRAYHRNYSREYRARNLEKQREIGRASCRERV